MYNDLSISSNLLQFVKRDESSLQEAVDLNLNEFLFEWTNELVHLQLTADAGAHWVLAKCRMFTVNNSL